MVDLNFFLVNEVFLIECEVCDCNEIYLFFNLMNE